MARRDDEPKRSGTAAATAPTKTHMDWALIKLILLQARGLARKTTRGAASPRRAAFLIVGLGALFLWLAPAVLAPLATHGHRVQTPQNTRLAAPLVLLAVCVLTIVSSAGDKVVSFTPGEVDMLFPGPFTRRQLLAYKLTKSALVALLTALVLSVAMLQLGRWWPATYVGVLLTLLFVQLFSTAGVLLGQAVSQRAHNALRRAVLVGALIAGVLFGRQWLQAHGGMEAVYAFRDSDAGRAVLRPFESFGNALTSESAPELARWAGEAIAINAMLLVLVALLDANYLEAALSASRRRYAQIQRLRSGRLLGTRVRSEVRWRLPQPPWLGGSGPIAWRQATSAARSAQGLLMVLLIGAVAAGPLFSSLLDTPGTDYTSVLVGLLAWFTILLSGLMKFDFRGDLDFMENLKAMPLRPWAMALGQVIVPTLILTAAHVLFLASIAAITHRHTGELLAATFVALPFNALLMTTENLIFLVFPTRPAASSPGDFQVLGRQAIQLVMKAVAVILGSVVAFGIAGAVAVVVGGLLPLLTAIAAVLLLAEAAALIPAIAWAYTRFDPSVDTPA